MFASWALIRAAAVMFAGTPTAQQYVVQTFPVAPTKVQSESSLQAWSPALTSMSTHTPPSAVTAASVLGSVLASRVLEPESTLADAEPVPEPSAPS